MKAFIKRSYLSNYALIFGILSILCSGIIFGPLAIMKAKETNTKANQIGRGLGILGILLQFIVIIIVIVLIANGPEWIG